jgi:Rrf2 family transcriptional regulator, nitric oxide-sensitive transcriptional repressor
MNKINRKVEYALMALNHMRAKSPGELTSVKEISNLYGCPFDATARVLQILATHGILKSEQGAQGGYQLMKDLHRVSFLELSEMIMGPTSVAKCRDGSHEAECEIRSTCNILAK